MGKPPGATRRSVSSAVTLNRLPLRAQQAKLASRVAARVVEEIIASGWPTGSALGPASELADRYGVSRAVFREAVRLLEHQMVVRTKRGAYGGLVVVEPSLDAVIESVVLYLCRADARFADVLEARSVLETVVVDLAPTRITKATRQRLEAHQEAERTGEATDPFEYYRILSSLSSNPALELFTDILGRVSALYVRDTPAGERITQRVVSAHARVTAALLEGDKRLAASQLQRHLREEAEELGKRRATRSLLPAEVVSGMGRVQKRAESVARDIRHVVVSGRLEAGHFLGSEPDLLERYGVSRAVFREAVRLLEHDHVAIMRRGTGGGLFVSPPNVSAVTDIVAIYLAWRGTGLEALAELRGRVELSLVELAVDRLDPQGAAMLEASARLGEGSEPLEVAVHDLHVALAALAGNPVLELFALVLIRLTRYHQHRDLTEEQGRAIEADIENAHMAISRALQSGDVEVASKRMRVHLDAMSAFLR